MATAQLQSVPSDTAIPAAPANTVPFGTTLVHTWYLTGRKLHGRHYLLASTSLCSIRDPSDASDSL